MKKCEREGKYCKKKQESVKIKVKVEEKKRKAKTVYHQGKKFLRDEFKKNTWIKWKIYLE